jgi:hypothetical protein
MSNAELQSQWANSLNDLFRETAAWKNEARGFAESAFAMMVRAYGLPAAKDEWAKIAQSMPLPKGRPRGPNMDRDLILLEGYRLISKRRPKFSPLARRRELAAMIESIPIAERHEWLRFPSADAAMKAIERAVARHNGSKSQKTSRLVALMRADGSAEAAPRTEKPDTLCPDK